VPGDKYLTFPSGRPLRKNLTTFSIQFGDLFGITAPAVGNHDYGTPGAAG
jgi:hypothetical protein